MLPSSKVGVASLSTRSKKHLSYIWKEDPGNYNETADRNMLKEVTDRHKNMLLKVNEIVQDMDLLAKWKEAK